MRNILKFASKGTMEAGLHGSTVDTATQNGHGTRRRSPRGGRRKTDPRRRSWRGDDGSRPPRGRWGQKTRKKPCQPARLLIGTREILIERPKSLFTYHNCYLLSAIHLSLMIPGPPLNVHSAVYGFIENHTHELMREGQRGHRQTQVRRGFDLI